MNSIYRAILCIHNLKAYKSFILTINKFYIVTLSQLELLTILADCKNYSKTGKLFGITQPAVSIAIRKLEEELGIELIDKSSKSFMLTKIGESIVSDSQDIISLINKIKNKAALEKGGANPRLTIGALESVTNNFLDKFLILFRRKHPSIELNIIEGTDSEILAWIKNGAIDIGLNSFADGELVQHIIIKDHFYLVAPVDHALSKMKQLKISDLNNIPFIMPDCGCAEWIKKMTDKKAKLHVICSAKETDSILSMVKGRVGCSIIPKFALPNTFEGVRYIPIDTDVVREIRLGYNKKNMSYPKKLLIDFLLN